LSFVPKSISKKKKKKKEEREDKCVILSDLVWLNGKEGKFLNFFGRIHNKNFLSQVSKCARKLVVYLAFPI